MSRLKSELGKVLSPTKCIHITDAVLSEAMLVDKFKILRIASKNKTIS